MKHTLDYSTTFQGMKIAIENKAGSIRKWHDPRKPEDGETKMLYPYGYVKGTLGLDGDEVDVFLGPDKDSDKVFVITQLQRFEFEEVDEQKVMLGFKDADRAKTAYLQHFDNARFFGDMQEMTVDEFKTKVKERKGKLIKALYLKKSVADSNIFKGPNLYLETNADK